MNLLVCPSCGQEVRLPSPPPSRCPHCQAPLPPSMANPARDAAARKRFLREARLTAGLHSDNVVTVHQVGEINDVPFLAMELLQGETLAAWLRRGQRPTPAQVLDVGLQVARGLEAAHAVG